MSTPWTAPTTDAPVHATVPGAGSKSVTNRALLLAALADGPSTLRSPLRSRDTLLMAAALRALGVGMVDVPAGGWRVDPPSDGLVGDVRVDCGLAGTVMRFVPPAAALARGAVWFDGDPRARERPMGVMLSALRSMGISVDGDALPFAVHGVGRVAGGCVTLDASASSQFVSGLLLSGARFERGVEVRHVGQRVPSLPHIEMTLDMLAARGVSVSSSSPATWRVGAGPIRAVDCDIEPDLSNAAVYLAAAAVTGGRVTVPGWPASTTQAGDAIRGMLAAMGCSVVLGEGGLSVQGPPRGELTGLDVDLHDVGELTPTVAAVAALASGPSQLRGVAHLRGHETDRLAALAAEINGLGGCVVVTSDGLRVDPRPLHGGPWRSYADHRMATAGAVIGLVVPGVEVDDIGCTSKTIPDFPAVWASLLDGVPAE